MKTAKLAPYSINRRIGTENALLDPVAEERRLSSIEETKRFRNNLETKSRKLRREVRSL